MSLNMMMHQQLYQQAAHIQQPQQQQELYSGQWTKEEQDYVTFLVEGFKEGSLDIPDGTSLRFYIAAELGCKPKRVSKKYERTGYNGKHVFHKDASLSEEELQKRSDRRQKLEVAFRKSRALVVSMQEAKGGGSSSSKNRSQESNMPSRGLPTSSMQGVPLSSGFNSNLVALQSMDQRLALMRGQIERSTAALAMAGRGGYPYMQPSAVLGGGLGGSPRSEMLYSMLMANQARPGVSQFGSSGFSSFSPLGAGPAPQGLLQDIYQRRQQILRNSAARGDPPITTPLGTPFAGAATTEATSPVSTKRSLETLSGTNNSSPPIADPNESVEEPDAKRARAA